MQAATRHVERHVKHTTRFLLPEGRASGGLCDLHLLAVTGGQERTQKELETLLGAAGFTSACQVHRLSSLPSVLLAKKSGGS